MAPKGSSRSLITTLSPGLINQTGITLTDKAALWVAQVAYKARMVDIKQEIHREEDKFKSVRARPTPPPSAVAHTLACPASITLAAPYTHTQTCCYLH